MQGRATPAPTNCAWEVIPAPPFIQPRPRVVPRILLFLFWTVHGPFSRFLLEEKEKMGGALHQPSIWLYPPSGHFAYWRGEFLRKFFCFRQKNFAALCCGAAKNVLPCQKDK